MPTYDYECDACGHTMEVFQGINEPVKKKCPECKKNKLKRLFGTGAAIVFKGSGFYQTDYRSEGYKKAAKKDSESSKSSADSSSADSSKADSSKTGGGKTESKKTETKSSESSSKKKSTD